MEPKDIIGKTEQAARTLCESQGIKCRVTRRDGRSNVVTSDFRPHDRMNLEVKDGIVTRAYWG